MSRISSFNPYGRGTVSVPWAGEPSPYSCTQLTLDAAFSSFSTQATDTFSIASMTAAGLAGRLARVGILSAFPLGRHIGLPLQFISHLGSVGVEAATFSVIPRLDRGIQNDRLDSPIQSGNDFTQDFITHFINFATFRLLGTAFQSHNPLRQHLVQSAAMMAGHQVAAALHLEETSHASLTEQFLEANLATLQIAVGSALASRITAGRLQRAERNLESGISRNKQPVDPIQITHSLPCMTGDQAPPPPSPKRPRRGATPVMERLSGPPAAIEAASPNGNLPRPSKEQILRFHSTLEAYMNLLREGFVCLGLGRQTATAVDIHRMYEHLYGIVPSSGQAFSWRGFLGHYLRSFSDYILQAEGTLSRDPELDSLKDRVIDIHDKLMLLQDALRIFQHHQTDLNEDEKGLLALDQQAHEGLRLDRQTRRTRLTAATHGTAFLVSPEHQQYWTDLFIGTHRDPYLLHNVNIIMGNVTLVAAEYVGGSFYRSLGRSAVANRVYRVVPFYYDMTTGQILAFADRSEISATTQENLRRRKKQVGEGRFFVDVEELGAIVSVQLEEPEHTRNSARERVEGLRGLHVVQAPSPLRFVKGTNETGKWNVAPSQRTRLVPGEETNPFYRILGIANPDALSHATLSLLTLNPYANSDELKSIQLWIPRSTVSRFEEHELVWIYPAS